MAKAKFIHEQVYQIGGSSLSDDRDCSVYMIVTGKRELILIDSGAGPSYPILVRNIQGTGFDITHLNTLILTHGHIDHIGGAPDFVADHDSKVIAHEGDIDAIEGKNTRKTAAEWYGVDFEPVKVDDVISGEAETRRIDDLELHLLHTPGHTPGSMVVYLEMDGSRILFGQDIHGPFDEAFGSDIDLWRQSMQKLLALEADILCEGHFGVYRGRERVRQFIEGYLASQG